MEETKEIPTIVVVRPRPLAVGDLVLVGRVVRKSSQQITCNTWANREDYTLDYIFPYNVTQSEIFDCIISPLVNHALDGYTSLAVLYGQTGTGKTYTLLGYEPAIMDRYKDSSIGQIPRALLHIFEYLRQNSLAHEVLVSFFEVYNEIPRDLLAKANPWGYDDDKAELKCLDDITEAEVRNYYQFKDMLRLAQRDQESVNAMRQTSDITNVYIINITSVSDQKPGKIVFVELAGAECFGKFDEMERLSRQLGGTRKTLYALNKVIFALNSREETIPFMESKLTRILRNILNPNCQIAVIATISPCARSLQETANTLDYAEQLRFENRRDELRFPEPEEVAFRVPEPPLEMEMMVHKVQQMRERMNNAFQGDIVNFERLECIINSVDDLYDEIKMMESECSNVHFNYDVLAENISAQLHMPNETGDSMVGTVEVRTRQRNLESILEPLEKWKDRINFFVTTYDVISVIGDSRLRFKFKRINHLPPKFQTFHLPNSRSRQPSQKGGETSPVTLVVKSVKTRSKRKRRRNKWAKHENIQLVDEPMIMKEDQNDVEKQVSKEEESVASASCQSLGTSKSKGDLEVKERHPCRIGYWRKELEKTNDESAKTEGEIPSAHNETTSEVKNSSPKHKEQSSAPAGSKQSSARSIASVEGVKKTVQDVMKMLEEVREQLEKLENE